MSGRSVLVFILSVTLLLVTTHCSDDVPKGKGKIKIYLTDSPVDSKEIDAVVLAIKKIELLGRDGWITIEEFQQPLSINILDYQNGDTYYVADKTLDAGEYTGARLILDAAIDSDATIGAAQSGCYIRYNDGTSMPLYLSSEITNHHRSTGSFSLASGSLQSIIIDFDVRKSIVKATGSDGFLLKPTVRMIPETGSALIKGYFAEHTIYPGNVVIYAYHKGSYQPSEANSLRTGEPNFNNAVTSSMVNAQGNFTLAFLPPADYDLVLVHHGVNGEVVEILGQYKNARVGANAKMDLSILISL